mgnify:CR=1 FL=1
MESCINTLEGCIASSQTKAKGCIHHWMIEAANGKLSQGRCEKCQETRQFDNSISEDVFIFSRKENYHARHHEDI